MSCKAFVVGTGPATHTTEVSLQGVTRGEEPFPLRDAFDFELGVREPKVLVVNACGDVFCDACAERKEKLNQW